MPSPLETRMWAIITDPSTDARRKYKCAAVLCHFIFQLRGETYRKTLEQVRDELGIEDEAHSTPADALATATPSDGGGELLREGSEGLNSDLGDDECSSELAHDGSNESLGSDNGLEEPESAAEDAEVPHLSSSGDDEDRATRVPDGYIEYFDYDNDDAVPVQYARCDGFYRRLKPIAAPHPPQPPPSPSPQGFAFPTPIPKDPEQYRRYIDALPAPEPDVPPVESVRACFGLEASSSHEISRLLDAHGHHALTVMKALGHRLPAWADEAEEELERYCDREKLIRRNGAFQGVTISGNDIPTNLLVCKYQRGYGDGCRKADCHFSHNLAAHICKHWLSNPGGCVMKDACPYSHNPYTAVVRGKEPDVPGNPCYPRNLHHPPQPRLSTGPSPTFTVATASSVTDGSRPTTAMTAATNITVGTRDTTAPSTPYGKECLPAVASTAAAGGAAMFGHDAPSPSCAPREPAADRERRLQRQQQQRPRPLMQHSDARQGNNRSGLSSAEGSRPSVGCEVGDGQGGEAKEEEEDMDAMFPPLHAAASMDTKAERRRRGRRNG